MKAASDTSHFFLSWVIFLGHNIECTTIIILKSRKDALLKLKPPSNKKNPRNPRLQNAIRSQSILQISPSTK